jgi:hypothetical protein
MKKPSASVVVAMLAYLLIACQCSKILTATFEADALNSPPATNLPGAPAGDEIQYHAAIEPRLEVQNSAISGSKALRYIDNPISDPPPVASQWIGFRGIGTDLEKTLWFTYTGQYHGVAVTIDISDGHVNTMGRMKIADNGDVSIVHSFTEPEGNLIGKIGTGVHTVVFTVSASELKYNVSIIKEGGSNIVAENQPMITTDKSLFSDPAHPTISFLLANPSGSLNFYEIGSVYISRKQP